MVQTESVPRVVSRVNLVIWSSGYLVIDWSIEKLDQSIANQ